MSSLFRTLDAPVPLRLHEPATAARTPFVVEIAVGTPGTYRLVVYPATVPPDQLPEHARYLPAWSCWVSYQRISS